MKTKPKSDWEKEYKKGVELEEKITDWARNTWGLDDEDCLSSSEAYEMLEEGIKFFSKQARQEGIREAMREIKGLKIADYGFLSVYQEGYNSGVDNIVCFLEQKISELKKKGGKYPPNVSLSVYNSEISPSKD